MIRRLLVVLLGIELLDELVFGARGAALPSIQDDLGLSYAEIGLLLAIPNVASAALEPLFGVLGDVWSRRTVVVGGGLVYAAALGLVVASGGFWSLLLAFVILYPATGAFVSLSQATLMDADPGGRERNMVRWTFAGSVGALLGPPLVAVVVFLDLGWRAAFAATAVATLGLALASLRIPSPPVEERPAFGTAVRDGWRAVRSWAVLRWLALLEASDLLLDVFAGFVALYLAAEAGLSAGQAALALTVWVGADLVGNVLVLRLLRRTTGTRYLRASAIAGGLLLSAFVLVPGTAAKLVLLALLGISTAGWYPLLKARLYDELPGRSGTAMSISALTDPIGALPPIAIGLVADQAGLDVALWLLLIAPLTLLVLVPRERLA